jgi:hypothetical protein
MIHKNEIRGRPLEKHGAPYGEARRLRYFVTICNEVLKHDAIDLDLLIDRIIVAVQKINPKLTEYVRTTGIMKTKAVTRNYIRFADWLNLIKIENRLVTPTSYTVFFACLEGREDFYLSDEEKIGFFLKLIELNDLLRLIKLLRIRNSIQDLIVGLNLSEHFVESFFEWLVDLGILNPVNQKFGNFNLTNLGYHVREDCTSGKTLMEISETYIENLLGINLQRSIPISDDLIWLSFHESLKKLASHVRSEVDRNLYSAFPLVLDLQLRLVLNNHLLISITELIEKLKHISTNHNSVFSWDKMANAGYIKILGD